MAWMMEEAEKAPVYCAWEDLHWADPSTLELLALYLEPSPYYPNIALYDISSRIHPALGLALLLHASSRSAA